MLPTPPTCQTCLYCIKSVAVLIRCTVFLVMMCVTRCEEEKKKRLIELVNKSLKEEIRHLPPAEKRGILLNQIFSLCSVCRHNSCFPPSRSLLAGISCSGMALSRLEEIDLMAQKAASNVDTFLFSFMPVFFFLSMFAPNVRGTRRKRNRRPCIYARLCRCVCRRHDSRQVFKFNKETDL